MRFGDLTFREIHERAEAGWLAVVPTGCTEQQGPHLSVEESAESVARWIRSHLNEREMRNGTEEESA